jgi:CrcB protein
MSKLFFIALGGAGGALLRYAVARGAAFLAGPAFPWGTLAANLSGCLAIGFLSVGAERAALPPEATAFLLTGLLGAFTTFSTYGLESVRLLQSGAVWRGGGYLLASNALGLALVAGGMAAARYALPSV